MARRRTAAGSGLLRKRSGPKRSLREGATLFLLQRPDVVAALLLGEPLGRGAQQRLMREYAATGAPAASHASFSRALQVRGEEGRGRLGCVAGAAGALELGACRVLSAR